MVAPLGNATVNVLARTVLFEQSLKRSLKRMSLLTAGIFAGVGAANFLGGAIKNSLELEKSIARTKALLEGSKETASQSALFDAKMVRDFSNSTGIAAVEVAEAMRFMASSGVKSVAEIKAATKAAADIAVGQGADLAKTADFVSTALNAYGAASGQVAKNQVDAAGAADILVQALNDGKGSMNDFSKYVSTAIPIASQLGVSLEEVASFAAANTLTGSSARKVFTGLAYSLRGLNNETKGIGKAFKDINGKGFKEFVKGGGSVQDAVKMLGTEIGASQITNIEGAETGLNALQSTLGLWDKYVDVRTNAANADGVAAASADKVNNTFARQLEIVKNQLVNFRGGVGDWLGPILGSALAKLSEWAPKIKTQLASFGTQVKAVFDAVYPVIKPAIDRIVAAFQSVDWAGVAAGIAAFFAGVAAVIGPIIIVVAYAFAGLVSAAAPLINILTQMKPVLVTLGFIWGTYRVLLLASTVATVMHAIATNNLTRVTKASWIVQKLATAALFVKRAALLVATIATGAYNFAVLVATGGLNRLTIALTLAAVKARLMGLATTFALGPIGLIIIAIAALAAGFIYAWKKSDKFKQIVMNTWNAVKNAALTAIKFILDGVEMYVVGILTGFLKILQGLGKLPKWLGGGKFDSAARFVQGLIDGVHAIGDSLDGLIAKAKAANWEMEKLSLQDVMSRAAKNDAERAIATQKSLADWAAKRNGGGGPAVPDFSGGGYDPGAADDTKKAADTAAKEAAAALKAAMNKVKVDLNRIAKSTSKQSVDTIKQNFKTLYEDLKEAGKAGVIKSLKGLEKQLVSLGKKRDQIIEQLGVAKDKLKGLKDEAKSFTDNIKETVNGLGNVAQQTRGIEQTFTGIRNQLRYAIAATQQFNQNIERLRELGLNEINLKQLISAGPEGGAEAARILAASGQSGVNEINNLQGQLGKAGSSLADSAYDEFFKQGINMAKGLVKGLESEQEAILKQMDKLGDRIAERFKKSLGIKSPSAVFAGMGEMIPAGLSKGIDTGAPMANRSAQNMIDSSITFGPGSISVNGVSDPKAAQRAGILSGKGIQSVLSQRNATRQLAGVG